MSHTAEPQARRRLDRVFGALILLVGAGVLTVAFFALQNPHGRSAGVAKQSIATDSAGNVEATDGADAASGSAAPASSSAAGASSAAASSSPATSPATSAANTSTASVTAKSIPLIVLNNTTTTGLADQARDTFVSGGWKVTSVGNLTNNIASTCVYYDPSSSANLAAANALQAQFPAIKRVKPKFDGLPSGPLVVVLTPDYSS